jgi:phosphatidylserine decarboxylase
MPHQEKKLEKSFGESPHFYLGKSLIQEQVEAGSWLSFFYQSRIGKFIRPIFTHHSFISKLAGLYKDSWLSKHTIKPFIQKHAIPMNDFEKDAEAYHSFNDFFSRKLKLGARNIDTNPLLITSPVDGKLFIISHLDEQADFFVKGQQFDLEQFLQDKELAHEYRNGVLMILRLAPYDYHRYHFPVNCTPSNWKSLSGIYESVNSLVYASNVQPLIQNQRHLVTLKTEKFENIIMGVVGALMVGKIVETYVPNQPYKKGDEMGYFEFGGSTVTLLFKANTIKPLTNIVKNSLQGFETAIKMGEAITEEY